MFAFLGSEAIKGVVRSRRYFSASRAATTPDVSAKTSMNHGRDLLI